MTELGPGEIHRFSVDLAAGDLLDVEVEQKGVDLTLRILDVGGDELLAADGPYGTRETERAIVEAETGGPFVVELRAGLSSSPGAYELHAVRRPMTPADRPVLEAVRLHAAGDQARKAGEWQTASDSYARAAELWHEVGDGRGETIARHRLGQVRRHQNDVGGATTAFLEAKSTAHLAGLVVAEADLTFGIGQLRKSSGDLADAVRSFDEAASMFDALGERKMRALAINAAAGAHELLGDLDATRRAYGQALDIARRLGDVGMQGVFLTNQGWAYLRLGQSELALDAFQEALDFRHRADDRRGEGITLTDCGIAERRLGRLDEARGSFLAAWRLLYAEADRPRMANALMGLGWTDLELGRLDLAERAFTSASQLLAGSDLKRPKALVLLDLAEVHLARDEGDAARKLAGEALGIFDTLADRHGQASACFAIGRAERLRGRLEVAYRFLTVALERVESIRERAQVDLLRTSYLAFRREYYEQAVDLAMELDREHPDEGWAVRAVEVSERGRARSLLETLSVSGADFEGRLDETLRERESEVEDRLIDLEIERVRLELAGAGSKALDGSDRKLRRASLELAEVRDALRATAPNADLLRPEPFDVERFVAHQLDPNTVLLEISLGEESGHLLLIDQEGVAGVPLPGRERLDSLARLVHHSLQESQKPLSAGQAARALRELSREVLGPIADRLGDRRLAVVADGALQYVPFGALPDPRRLEEAEPPPLLERNEIVTLPSASVLEVLRRPRGRRATKTLAMLADPVFGRDDPRLATVLGSGDERRDAPDSGQAPRRLPFTADEARAVLALVPESERFAALGFDARVELLESGALADYRILHLATHGRLNASHPELSGLELSRFDADGRERRGTLYAHQIYDLPLGADLVVLSACNTALGREIRGEGLVGLTRGFFQAGASRVVVSLWSVDDEATTELMILFYRHLLGDGLPPAAALRSAQLELRSRARWKAPFYWAGFVVQGDWR